MNHFLKVSWARYVYTYCRSYINLTLFSREYSQIPGNFDPESWKSMEGLVRCPANYVPLSPITFLERSAKVYRDRTSLVYGAAKYTWGHTHQRCLRLASALTQLGISSGDVVSLSSSAFALLFYCCNSGPNVPAMYELHFAVPMAGAVLCTLNARHDSAMVSILLRHSEAKIIFVDYQLLEIARGALDLLAQSDVEPPILVLVTDSDGPSPASLSSKTYEYEGLLEMGTNEFEIRRPKSEWDPISINYTSGTTSRPKGVVYSHRGAYLNTLATVLLHGRHQSMPQKSLSKGIFDNIAQYGVTHMGGAPTMLNMIVNSPVSDRRPLPHRVEVMTGGSPPPPQVLFKMEEMGFGVNHLYGLTETYGPGTYCTWKPEWDSLPPDERSKIKARQGVQHLGLEEGNTVMSGYLRDIKTTEEAFKGGWFRSGDLAVKHHDNYIEVKDRLKDIIISGGENISTVEVETVLFSHPAVLEAAVVGRPDEHWGQTPCAFVKLKEGFDVNDHEIIQFCREHLPHYMAPKTVIFDDIPKTSTGKIQKFILRERAKALGSPS
ncbi:hypothetical protein FNV43_RR18673 [Rhamnella rubrinervis]|uniref:Uncharacterized protein n=1 Tax=Rhamnella rubrinervis TaxID=2594499 RepID=A0A8K0E6Q2_9ROSA|nr:hypothetical protein FNV43_RR18673 [Rhamnella rubrinervis]